MALGSDTELLHDRKAVAAAAKNRLAQEMFDFGANDRLRMVFDLEMHLAFLATALRCRSTKLFTEYVAWTHQLLRSTGRDSRPFLDCMDAIEAEITGRGEGPWVDQALTYLAAARLQVQEPPPVTDSHLTDDNPHRELAENFLHACLQLQRPLALAMIHAAVRDGVSVREIYLDVITPALHELGRLWHINRITVGQEHYCTAVAQMVMAQLFPNVFAEERRAGRLLCTCVAGELHEVGARMLADLFEMNGWDTVFLGADVPGESVINTLIQHDAQVLAISATLGSNLGDVGELIREVRATPALAGVRIMVGGAAFNADPTIWRRLGADGSAPDPQAALDLAASWKG